jgi:hypothetical protein
MLHEIAGEMNEEYNLEGGECIRVMAIAGRWMNGRKCLGAITPDAAMCIELCIRVAFILGEDWEHLRNAKTDRAGYGIAVYWPHLTYVEPKEENSQSPVPR